MKICYICGNSIDVNDEYCPGCGRPIGKICPNCGYENSIDSEYCEQCEKPLNGKNEEHEEREEHIGIPKRGQIILSVAIALVAVIAVLTIPRIIGGSGAGSGTGAGSGAGSGTGAGSSAGSGTGAGSGAGSGTGAAIGEGEDPGGQTALADGVPSDATLIGDNYYKVYNLANINTWQKAQQYCAEKGGHLAVITSEELNDELYILCRSQGFNTAFFGFSDAGSEGDWLWVTQAQPGYRNWGVGEPSCVNRDEDYAMFSTTERSGEWDDAPFGYETTAFICQWGDAGIEDSEVIIEIPEDALVYNGHSYYVFDNGMESWGEAEQYCKSLGGYMACINDAAENEEVYKYMMHCHYICAFFGYSDKEHEGIWEWYGNDKSTFEDWGVNVHGVQQPNQDAVNSDYAQLLWNKYLTGGLWNDAVFGENTNAYICEWDTVREE